MDTHGGRSDRSSFRFRVVIRTKLLHPFVYSPNMGIGGSRPARRNDPPSEAPSRTRGLRILRTATSNNPFTALGLSKSTLDGLSGSAPIERIRRAHARRSRHLQPFLAKGGRETRRFEQGQASLQKARDALLKKYGSRRPKSGQRIVY